MDEVNLVVMAEMTVEIMEMIDRTQDLIIVVMTPESPIQNVGTAETLEIKKVTVVVIVVEGVPEAVEVTGVNIINLTYQAAILTNIPCSIFKRKISR